MQPQLASAASAGQFSLSCSVQPQLLSAASAGHCSLSCQCSLSWPLQPQLASAASAGQCSLSWPVQPQLASSASVAQCSLSWPVHSSAPDATHLQLGASLEGKIEVFFNNPKINWQSNQFDKAANRKKLNRLLVGYHSQLLHKKWEQDYHYQSTSGYGYCPQILSMH